MNTPSFLLFLYTRWRGASPVTQSQPKIPERPLWRNFPVLSGHRPKFRRANAQRNFLVQVRASSHLRNSTEYTLHPQNVLVATDQKEEGESRRSLPPPLFFLHNRKLRCTTCRSAVVLARLGGRLHVTEGELFFEIHIFSWGAPSCHHKVS